MKEIGKSEGIQAIYTKALTACETLLSRAELAEHTAQSQKSKKRARFIQAKVRYFMERTKTQHQRVQILSDDGALRGACMKFDKIFKGFVLDAADFEKELDEIENDF